jgi:hypothetical protein
MNPAKNVQPGDAAGRQLEQPIITNIINIADWHPAHRSRYRRQLRPILHHKLAHQVQAVQQSAARPDLAIPNKPFFDPMSTRVLFLKLRKHETRRRGSFAS